MTIEIGRKAVERREWADAVAAFHEADQSEALSPEDLELLADASWWAGEPDESVEVLERAYAGHVERGSETGPPELPWSSDTLPPVVKPSRLLAGGWRGRIDSSKAIPSRWSTPRSRS